MSKDKFFYKYKGISDRKLLEDNLDNIRNNEFYAAGKYKLNDPNEFYIDDKELMRNYKNIDRIYSDAIVLGEYNIITKGDLERLVEEEVPVLRIPKSVRKAYRTTRIVDSEDYSKQVTKSITYINRLYEKLMNSKEQISVFSLTDRYDNELMWAHYAESHTGFVIQYAYDPIENDDEFLTVKYEESPPKLGMLDLKFGDDLTQKLVGIKSKEWSYENECRLIRRNEGVHSFSENNVIKGIYFGANMKEDIQMNIYKKLQGIDLQFFKMRSKKGSYKLEAIKYQP